MNRYRPSTPRVAFAIAALAMTAVTAGVAIVAPSRIGSGDAANAATAAAPAPARTEVAIIPSRIDVIGTREKTIASETAPAAPAKPKRDAS